MKTYNDQQHRAIQAVEAGHSIFLTGSAGTGKSYTIQGISDYCKDAGKVIGITAMTGCAALLIEGTTLHSFLGIGLGEGKPEDLANNTRRWRPRVFKQLEKLDLLVIDEVSMLSSQLFDKINTYLQIIRRNPNPFGGVQLVLSGDIHQLKSVDGDYIFQSSQWSRVIHCTIVLRVNMRQSEDPDFQEILEHLRTGQKLLPSHIELLRQRILPAEEDATATPSAEKPPILFPRLAEVDGYNQLYMERLFDLYPETVREYPIILINGSVEAMNASTKTLRIPQTVVLCKGCKVMLTYNVNIETRLVNGLTGTVKSTNPNGVSVDFGGFQMQINYQHMKNSSLTGKKKEDVEFQFLPLTVAFAISIHKAQGVTLSELEVDLGKTTFAPGQGYTALSRVRSLKGLRLRKLNLKSLKMDPVVVEFYQSVDASATL